MYLHCISVAPVCKRLQFLDIRNTSFHNVKYKLDHNNKNDYEEENNEELNTSRYQIVNLLCEVEANPTNVSFHWSLNNSRDSDIILSKHTNDGIFSRLRHTLRADEDYGTFGCWASNIVGYSKQPCLYHINPPG